MTAIDWASLKQLATAELEEALLSLGDESVAGIHDFEAQDEMLQRLPKPVWVVWVLTELEDEFYMGGLLDYFLNGYGRHARIAARALRAFGADGRARVLERGIEMTLRDHETWANPARWEGRQEFDIVTDPYRGIPHLDEWADLNAAYRDEWEREEGTEQRYSAYLQALIAEVEEGGSPSR